MTPNRGLLTLVLAIAASGAACAQGVTYDVRDFGARCDGSDDSRAINDALRAIPDGGTVSIPCEVAIGSAGLVLKGKRNVTVAGTDGGGGLRALEMTNLGVQGFGPVLFTVSYCQDCVIQDLYFEQNGMPLSAIGFDTCTNTTAQRLVIRNVAHPANAGLAAVGNVNNRYLDNTVTDTGNGPIGSSGVPDGGVRGLWIGNFRPTEIEWSPVISGNTVQRTGATGIAVHANRATITQNLVEDALGAGIKLEPDGPAGGYGASSLIQANTARRNLFHGVQVETTDAPVIIDSNTLQQNGIAGVYISGSAFSNSQIVNNVMSANREAGIYLYSGTDVLIQGNKIGDWASFGKNGIVLESLDFTMIRNIQITDNYIAGTVVSGLSLLARGGSLDSITVSGNSVTDSRMYGIVVDTMNGASVGITWGSNCFARLRLGILSDSSGRVQAPLSHCN